MSTRRVEPPRPDLVAAAIAPDYALGPHVAALGLTFSRGRAPRPGLSRAAPSSASTARGTAGRSAATRWSSSVRRRPPAGQPIDVLTGFLDRRGNAMGRPVGVAIARDGALLVADDVGNTVWRVSAAR